MVIFIDQLCFSYEKKQILDHLTFSLKKNEIVTLIGQSGAGKTTLFKLLTGLLSSDSGHILIENRKTSQANNYISYMTQEDLLLPWRTVLKNIVLPFELGKNIQSLDSVYIEALSLIEKMGLKGCENMFPDQLSGGMRQRVSLARALLQKKPLLLLDEPFGALDVYIREQLYALIKELRNQHQFSLLFITHDFRDALSLSDRIILLANGSIKQEWSIPHAIIDSPLKMLTLQNDLKNSLDPLII